jgi:rod shape determining protein RodA
MGLLQKFSPRSFDWALFSGALLLVAIGLAAIYSVDLSRGVHLTDFKKQLVSTGLGATLLIFASLTQYTWFRSYAKLFYGGCVTLLVLVLVFGTTIRGTRGWFTFSGFSFQPVELAKIGLIMILGYIVYHFGRRFDRPLFFFGTGITALIIMGLVMFQPDLGSAVIIGLIWFGIMLLVGVRARYVVGLLAVALVGALLAWL